MIKKSLLIALIALVLAGIAPAGAQENGWFVYLYNGTTNELVRVDQDGIQQLYTLDLGENVYVGGVHMAFSPDGSRVALCAVDRSAQTMQATARFIIRDLPAETNVLDIDLGTVLDCQTSRRGFNADGSQVAVSVAGYVPSEATEENTGPAWRLLILDTASGDIVHELNPAAPAVTEMGIITGSPMLPEVRHFTTDYVVFRELPWGVGGYIDPKAFEWVPSAGTLAPAPQWAGMNLDLYGDLMAWNAVDQDLPAGPMPGPVPATNVVMMAGVGGSAWMVYHDPEWMVGPVRFINQGQQVAILLYPPFDPTQTNEEPLPVPKWIAIDRAGTTSLLTERDYSDVINAPGGYALFEVQPGFEGPEPSFRLLHFTANTVRLLWQSSATGWEIAWSTPPAMLPDLPPFAAWTP